ncbi:phage baseplate plug family protein [Petrachloros mirabilis]
MTLIPFLPSNSTSPPFQTTVTLDGASYALAATYNIVGQRWYVSLTDLNSNLAWMGPLIGSPIGFDIPLAPGIFQTSTILYREDTNNFEVSP